MAFRETMESHGRFVEVSWNVYGQVRLSLRALLRHCIVTLVLEKGEADVFVCIVCFVFIRITKNNRGGKAGVFVQFVYLVRGGIVDVGGGLDLSTLYFVICV